MTVLAAAINIWIVSDAAWAIDSNSPRANAGETLYVLCLLTRKRRDLCFLFASVELRGDMLGSI